jgi:Lon-like protease
VSEQPRPHLGRQDDLGARDLDLRRRQRRRTVRAAVYAASLALLLWAASVVPLPYTEFVPGEPTSIPPLLEVSGADTTELTGDTALLTVLLQSSTTRTALGALLDGDRRLRPTAEVVPEDVDRDEFLEQERRRFRRQFEVAAAVGAEAAGVDVTLGTVPLVIDVTPGGPADGLLRAGDVVRSIDGDPVDGAEQLQQRVREHAVGDTITVALERRDEPLEVEVTLEPLELPEPPGGDDQEAPDVEGHEDLDEDPPPGMGIFIETVADRLELPFELELAETRIGGPSAGLMIALTVYDLFAEEDLLAGRTVHGTGSIDADGRVLPVGGVPEKMRAAAAAGADVVLVPGVLIDEALEAAPEELEVVGVDTFDEALTALRGTD